MTFADLRIDLADIGKFYGDRRKILADTRMNLANIGKRFASIGKVLWNARKEFGKLSREFRAKRFGLRWPQPPLWEGNVSFALYISLRYLRQRRRRRRTPKRFARKYVYVS
jgi:hypothetical protein